MDAKPFLTIHEYHLSRDKAREKITQEMARVAKPPIREIDWHHGSLNVSLGEVNKTVSFSELERNTRLTGIVEPIQHVLDQRDSVFGGTFDSATPNWQIKVKTEYAGYKEEVSGPCRVGLVVNDLTEDILHYRRETCLASADYGFRTLGRHFRAYLASCMSLVDAFINRHILLAAHEGFDSPAFTQLKAARGMEERVDSWLQTCSEKTLGDIAHTKEWCHFQELRQVRNALLHATSPFAIYSVKEVGTRLNYVRTGVGDLLFLLRSIHNKPSLMFIDRLRTAPEVRFHSITLRADDGATPLTTDQLRSPDRISSPVPSCSHCRSEDKADEKSINLEKSNVDEFLIPEDLQETYEQARKQFMAKRHILAKTDCPAALFELPAQEQLEACGIKGCTLLQYSNDARDEGQPENDRIGGRMIPVKKDGQRYAVILMRSDYDPALPAARVIMLKYCILYHELGHAEDLYQAINFDHKKMQCAMRRAEAYADDFAIRHLKRIKCEKIVQGKPRQTTLGDWYRENRYRGDYVK